MFCRNCGRRMESNDDFCINCKAAMFDGMGLSSEELSALLEEVQITRNGAIDPAVVPAVPLPNGG